MATPQVKDRLADYIPVNERLEQFYSQHPEGRVLTALIEHDKEAGFILMRAEIYRNQDDASPASTGHAFESRGEGFVNRTSYIENCETSAVGRALALMGYEIKRGIASREEMQKVERMSTPLQAVKPPGERETLIGGVKNAFTLLNKAGDVPPWTPKLMNEFAIKNFGVKVDDLELEPLRDMIKILSLRLDGLKQEPGWAARYEKDDPPDNVIPKCECGIARVRVEGITKAGKKKGQPWAMWGCANRADGCQPVWIDLDAEHERALDGDDMNWLETD